VGKPLQVLVESPARTAMQRWVGTTCRYAPIELTATSAQEGQHTV